MNDKRASLWIATSPHRASRVVEVLGLAAIAAMVGLAATTMLSALAGG